MKRLKVGLALGSGASRGLAHIGVIQTLLENNIPIDYVAGCSSGALIGAVFCCGVNLDFITNIAKKMDRINWMDFVVGKNGMIAGNKVEEFIRLITKNKNLEELDIPLEIVATNLTNCQRYIFRDGKVSRAVRASISLPGIFCPIKIDDMVLVDGGVIDRVPTSVVRDMGADIVIAVDVGISMVDDKFNNMFDIILHCLETMENEILKSRMMGTDVCIRPLIKNINPLDFTQVEICIEEGRRAALEQIHKIQRLLQKNNEDSA